MSDQYCYQCRHMNITHPNMPNRCAYTGRSQRLGWCHRFDAKPLPTPDLASDPTLNINREVGIKWEYIPWTIWWGVNAAQVHGSMNLMERQLGCNGDFMTNNCHAGSLPMPQTGRLLSISAVAIDPQIESVDFGPPLVQDSWWKIVRHGPKLVNDWWYRQHNARLHVDGIAHDARRLREYLAVEVNILDKRYYDAPLFGKPVHRLGIDVPSHASLSICLRWIGGSRQISRSYPITITTEWTIKRPLQ